MAVRVGGEAKAEGQAGRRPLCLPWWVRHAPLSRNRSIGKGDGRFLIMSPQASLVTVNALPSEINALKEFIESNEQSLQRQVVLEAKIIEVTLKDEYQQGVNWTEVLGNVGSTEFTFATSAADPSLGRNPISSSLGGITNLVFKNADFSGVLRLLVEFRGHE